MHCGILFNDKGLRLVREISGFDAQGRQSILNWHVIHPSHHGGTEQNIGGPLCVCTTYMQFKDPQLPLNNVDDSGGHGKRDRLESYGFCCTLKEIILSTLKDRTSFDTTSLSYEIELTQ